MLLHEVRKGHWCLFRRTFTEGLLPNRQSAPVSSGLARTGRIKMNGGVSGRLDTQHIQKRADAASLHGVLALI